MGTIRTAGHIPQSPSKQGRRACPRCGVTSVILARMRSPHEPHRAPVLCRFCLRCLWKEPALLLPAEALSLRAPQGRAPEATPALRAHERYTLRLSEAGLTYDAWRARVAGLAEQAREAGLAGQDLQVDSVGRWGRGYPTPRIFREENLG